MYGLVNQALEELLVTRHGDVMWREILESVVPDFPGFVSMKNYPDSLTYGLLAAASKRTGVAREDLLRQVGDVWIRYTAHRGYGNLLDLAGDTFTEFLSNLDVLHEQVSSIYPELQPPRFDCWSYGDGSHELHYTSDREGLAPFVIGLIEGLASRFGIEVAIEHVPRGSEKAYDLFKIREITI